MTRSTRLYFAYGSNLLPARLAARTPSARIISPAVLTGNRLAWHKHGVDDSGKCDIVKTGTLADRVFGAVYEIEVDDWNALDRAEELDVGYRACQVNVETRDGEITAHSYRALMVTPMLNPFDWYRDFVVAGAKAHKLPPRYIDQLRATTSTADPNDERARFNRRLLEQ